MFSVRVLGSGFWVQGFGFWARIRIRIRVKVRVRVRLRLRPMYARRSQP
jgi:hypothetical protein